MKLPVSEIYKKIGYVFRDESLLYKAFTHTSYVNVHGGESNERLEYLGDAVLQLIVTEWQYKEFTNATEGEMTKKRQEIVCEEALDWAVRDMQVQEYLLKEGGKANVGRKTVSSLFETLTAAIYLDGGLGAAKKFILDHAPMQGVKKEKNPKSALQEFLQQRGMQPPQYACIKTGKDNAPTFECTVKAWGESARGEGSNKKGAEQAAAKALLRALEQSKK